MTIQADFDAELSFFNYSRFTSTDVQVFVAFDIDITTLPEDLQEEASTARLGYAGASQEQANEREEAGLAVSHWLSSKI